MVTRMWSNAYRKKIADANFIQKRERPGSAVSLVIAGLAVCVMAARDAGDDPAGDELLGNHVHRPADPKDHLDSVLLEELHCTGAHASRDHVGYFMGCQVRGQGSRLVPGALQ